MKLATTWLTEVAQTKGRTGIEPTRPTIILPGGGHSITAAAEEIFGLIGQSRNLFYRGGRVHEIVAESDASRRLVPITSTQFRSLLETYGQLVAWRSGANNEAVLKPTLCPEETARALLESLPARERLPNVVTLTACPVFARTDDKGIVLSAGWHPHGGGIFVSGGEAMSDVPLDAAVLTLTSLLDDFNFPTPGDRSRALASLVAPALRFGGWLRNPLPVDIGEADASQSGKTYRQKIVAAIYRDTPNMVVQRTGGVGSMDESISQKLIDGRPFILLDNLRGKLDSPFLEAILTTPASIGARVPRLGEVKVDPRGFIFQITSNGVETTRDLANRASIVRIRKQAAGYKFRAYDEGDIYMHVVRNQSLYLGSVFAVIEHWAKAGQQRTNETRHDFREWAQVLDWIVQNIFSSAPLLDGQDSARERISDPRRTWLRALCIALRDLGHAGEINASWLAEFSAEHDMLPPGVRSDADGQTVARCIGKIMATVFGAADEFDIDGFKIFRAHRYSETAQKKVPTYHFGQFQPELPLGVPTQPVVEAANTAKAAKGAPY